MPDKAVIAAAAVVWPVPPLAMATVPVTLPAVPAVAAFRLATCVVDATIKGAVPVVTVEVITPEADTVVNAPVVAVVAPTVPFMLIEAVPVRLVTVPLLGVPKAPPLTTKAPAVPTFVPRAVITPVPVVVVLGAAPAPPPITKAFTVRAADEAHVLALEKYGMPPDVPATVKAKVPLVVIGEPPTEMMPPVKLWATLVTVPPVPVADMDIVPAPLVIETPVPADNVFRVKPVPLPMSNAPFAGVVVSPVPPLATATVPVTLAALPEMLPLTALPEIAIDVLVTLVTWPWALVTNTGTWLAEP